MDDLEKRAETMMTRRRAKYCCSDNHCMCDEDADLIEALLVERRAPSPATVALVEAASGLLKLNNENAPFGGEIYQDRIDRTLEAALAAYEKDSPDAT